MVEEMTMYFMIICGFRGWRWVGGGGILRYVSFCTSGHSGVRWVAIGNNARLVVNAVGPEGLDGNASRFYIYFVVLANGQTPLLVRELVLDGEFGTAVVTCFLLI